MMYYFFSSRSALENGHGELEVTNFPTEWKIPDFPPLKNKYKVSSPEFGYLGAKWCIDLYLKGEFFELCLRQKEEKPSNIWAHYVIGIKETDGTVYKSESGRQKVGAMNDPWRTKEFLRTNDLQRDKMRIVPEGVLVVFCNLSLKEKCERELADATVQTENDRRDASTEVIREYLVRPDDSGEEDALLNAEGIYKLSGDLQNLFLNGRDSDATIKIGDKEIKVHRAILGARSSVFESMFKHDTVERNTGTVEIQDCDPEVFEDFLRFLYSGKMKLSSENVVSLYELANKYDVQDVKVKYVNFMVDNLCVDNFCDFLPVAFRHNEQNLLTISTDFFTKNTKPIITSAKWQCFYKLYPVESNELFIKAIAYRDQW